MITNELISEIKSKINDNQKQAITGGILQGVLVDMVKGLCEVYPHTYTDEQKAQARANIDALSNYDGEITKEKLSAEVQAILNDVANKQNISDESLVTIAKTIVGAINEVYKGGLEDASIATSKIEDGAVTTPKIADKAVNSGKVEDSAITTDKLADKSVTNAKIGDYSITEVKIGNSAINTRAVVNKAITRDKIADGAISTAQIAEKGIGGSRLNDKTITTDKLADKSVTNAILGEDVKNSIAPLTDDEINTIWNA